MIDGRIIARSRADVQEQSRGEKASRQQEEQPPSAAFGDESSLRREGAVFSVKKIHVPPD
jgi:hypothetical protein